jgi:uncharacterized lipoprotein YddW (UPF0748 family)
MKYKKIILRFSIYFIVFSLIIFSLYGCDSDKDFSYLSVQTISQLHIENSENTTEITEISESPKTYAIWIPVMEYEYILTDKSEEEFSDSVDEMLSNIKENGYNTIYLHVRAYADAYYKSDIFSQGSYQTDYSYDVLEIITQKAKSLNIKVHAWINPLRCMGDGIMSVLGDNYIIKQWYNDSEKNGRYLVKVGNNYWLNPAYEEVINLICDGVLEIIENYNVDGIHIDDFFYPTTESYFDKEAFENSNFSNLSDFRLNQVNNMVSKMYDTVKSYNENLIFSISPQGTMSGNYDSQFSDVKKWASEEGFCDVIIPQLYYGFENESCPFKEKVVEWENIVTCEKVSLYIGICTYKLGLEDEFAGSGKNEWCENLDIIFEEVIFSLEREKIDGISIYSYTSTFHSQADGMDTEIDAIRQYLVS